MGALKLYNTLTRQQEKFVPRTPGEVSLYTCGPTTYAAAHIGNLRTYVFEDTLRRWLKYGHGLKVNQVMNITDVEDKILKRSQAATVAEMQAFTQPFEQQFHADLAALGIESAEHYPRATESVPTMIKLIERIIKNGYAYEREGSVYFDVQKHHAKYGYGKLLKIDFAGFAKGHRIDNDEYDKESVQDFALWKASTSDSPGWDSPWGYGRPGWHIECSAMAGEAFGLPVDIHAGAVDLTFPHHENEIAQTRAATGKDLSQFWLHGGHLLVDGAKMAKSAGNFHTLADVTTRHSPLALRLLFLQAHYRSKLNFTINSLTAAQQTLDGIGEFLERLHREYPEGTASDETADADKHATEAIDAAMDDDLGTPEALAAAFALMKSVNARIDAGTFTSGDADQVKGCIARLDQLTGLFGFSTQAVPPPVATLAEQRQTARNQGDYEAADRLRGEIEAAGWQVKDTASGQTLRKRG